MEKLKMHSPNLTDENIVKIREMFPDSVSEATDEEGKVRFAVDFDQLRQELSDHIVDGPQERYHLNWPGKKEALLAANAPIAKTLRPSRDESVNFDTTQNLFIEGDNLEALKLLQETYLGEVKMIYIDPPYNTGNDFVYDDYFADNSAEFLRATNQADQAGNRLVANPDSNGRFHSEWLSLIYPRLKLSKSLLADDGLIFISIDDHEVANMRRMSDSVFGESNFVAQIVWEKMYTTKNDAAQFSNCHEYVLVYAKDILKKPVGLLPRTAEMDARYTNPDNDPRGPWKAIPLYAKGERKNGRYAVASPKTGKEHWPEPDSHWLYVEGDTKKLIEDDRIYFGKDGNAQPNIKRFLTEVQQGTKAKTLWKHSDVGSNDSAKRELRELYKNKKLPFDFPKPTALIERMLRLATEKDQNHIVLDFFAGSGTTAHAVFKMNASDGGNRKFLVVQIDEPCDEKTEAFKSGYKDIAQISRERITLAGEHVVKGEFHGNWNKDVGFRVLRIDTSNMADVYYTPESVKQEDLLSSVDNIKAGRGDPEDLLFQVLVDWGVDLTLPIRRETVQGNIVFFVNEEPYDLIACFDTGITEAFVKELAKFEPMRVVFRDNGFVSDAVKINVDQIFRQLSPATDVKSI